MVGMRTQGSSRAKQVPRHYGYYASALKTLSILLELFLYVITAYFTSDFPQYFLGKGKVSYQLIFASFILQRPSEEEAFIKYFWKEGKKEEREE